MAVKIRLTRTGAKNAAAFRVVAADSRSPRDGRFIEILGWYDPKLSEANCKLKFDRIDHWVSQGAEVSDTVESLIKQNRDQAAADVVSAPVVEAVPEEAPVVAEEAAESAESTEEMAATTDEETAGDDEAKADA